MKRQTGCLDNAAVAVVDAAAVADVDGHGDGVRVMKMAMLSAADAVGARAADSTWTT